MKRKLMLLFFMFIFCVCMANVLLGQELKQKTFNQTTRSIFFDGEKYVLVGASSTDIAITNEYIPENETLENWTKMLTLNIYPPNELDGLATNYLNLIKKYIYPKNQDPDIILKEEDNSITIGISALLKDGDHLEYIQSMFRQTKDSLPSSLTFSLRVTDENMDYWVKNLKLKKNEWLMELDRIDF